MGGGKKYSCLQHGMGRKVKAARIDLGDVTDKNIGQLKLLNRTVFPVSYGEPFYKSVLSDPTYLTQLAFYGGDALVGAVCARLEKKDDKSTLYIMTLGVLAPYRDLGIGKQLLEYVEDAAKTRFASDNVQEIYLHVQEGNDAIKFYSKYGFEGSEKVEKYYQKIEPNTAIVLRKTLTPTEENSS